MDTPRSRQPLKTRLAGLILLCGLAACGDAEEPGAGLSLGPGDSLLDHPEALRVEVYPASNLPEERSGALASLIEQPQRSLAPGAWTPFRVRELVGTQLRDLNALALLFRDELGELAGRSCWSAQPELRFDSGAGRVELAHHGRVLPGVMLYHRAADDALVWFDEQTPQLFWWDAQRGRLLAFGPRPPGELSYRFSLDEQSILAVAEWRAATGAAAPSDARALELTRSLGDLTRRCLLAPAPTTLSVSLERLPGRRLQLAVGVLDLNRALRDPHPGDGVSFSIELVQEGRARTVWSRHVRSDEGFVELEIALTDALPGPLELRLLTQPGPAGDARYDHALWGGLRFMDARAGPPSRPHVILIDVDTLRADRLGCYGYERDTTPRLDAWAAREAEVFFDSMAVANWTLPSTVSLLSGLSVDQHGVRDTSQRLSDSVPSLAERLHAAGYETLARTDGGYVSAAFGFARGFDRFEAVQLPWKQHHSEGWSAQLERLSARDSARPVFLFLQTYQVHTPLQNDHRFDDQGAPYASTWSEIQMSQTRLAQHLSSGGEAPDARDRRWVSDQYDAAVRRMDDVVGAFLEGLPAVFGDQPYVVLLTSDHGEEIFERGGFGHRHSLHAELLQVPLIVRHADGLRIGFSDAPASGLDVLPTILDSVGLPVPDELPGLSLRSPAPRSRARVAAHRIESHAFVSDGWKLLQGAFMGDAPGSAPRHLYRLADDPTERHDLADARPEQTARLSAALAAHLARQVTIDAAVEQAAPDEELAEQLRQLGYLGGHDDG